MDWMSLFGVFLGGLLTLAGQAVQGFHSRRAEVRRRGDDAAMAARDVILEVEGYLNGLPFRLDGSIQGDAELVVLVRKLRRSTLLITDREVRERLDFVARVMGYSTAIEHFHGDSERSSIHKMCQWGNELLGAHLRGERHPKEPEEIAEYRSAISEADAIAAKHEVGEGHSVKFVRRDDS